MGTTTTDAMFSRLENEVDERKQFIDGIVEAAHSGGRDIDPKEMELITRAKDRIVILNQQLDPLRDTIRIADQSSRRVREMASELAAVRTPEMAAKVEYRSAGAYVLDFWKAGIGVDESRQRLDMYQRAAAHQTTGDNPGLLPEQILSPVLNFVDTARPIVSALGPKQLPSGSWSRPTVTQHSQVGIQTAEKTELPSRKLIIGKIPVNADTYGGYVNVSRQNIDWTQPSVMDIVINDLAGEYAVETEGGAADIFVAAATAGPVIPTGPTTGDAVAQALWTAAAAAYSAMRGQGTLVLAVAPDMLGLIGPLFAPVNPQSAQSSGFSAGAFGSGPMGAISGIQTVMSAGLPAGTALVISTAAAEVYEDRIGALQVVEPSVLGVQVAYAGYFAALVIEAEGIIKITKTP